MQNRCMPNAKDLIRLALVIDECLVEGGDKLVSPLRNPSKKCVLPIQILKLLAESDEKLAAVGIGALVDHGDEASGFVPQAGVLELVLEEVRLCAVADAVD